MDPLRRGWSPTQATRIRARILLGALLVLSPAYVGWLGIGQPTYQYETTAVDTMGGELVFEGEVPPDVRIDGIDCRTVSEYDRQCALEQSLTNETTTVADGPFVSSADQFAVHDGQVYRRTADENRLGLEPVAAQTALDSVAQPKRALSPHARLVLASGSLALPVEISASGWVIDTDTGYVLLYESSRVQQPILDDPLFVGLLELCAVIGGFKLLYSEIQRREAPN